MLSDDFSCPVLTAAASYLFTTWGINKACTTLGRLEEKKDRSCCDPLWLLKPLSKHSSYMNSSGHTTHGTHTHTHINTHLHTHTCKVAPGEWEAQWKL